MTDALWIQPWFSDAVSQRLKSAPFSRSTVGMNWEMTINPIPHAENDFQDNLDGYLHFLTLTNRESLTSDDLTSILQTMGIMRQAQFQQLCDLLVDLRIESGLNSGNGFSDQLKHRYILRFQEYDASLEPLMETFLHLK